jgi:TatD DNase family protein
VIDSHCHLDNPQFDPDREAVIDRALAAGVERMVVIGTGEGPPDLEAGIRLADKHESIYATVGVHPHDASKATRETFRGLRELLKHPKVIALGEIGLDYHYDYSPREIQRDVFLKQMLIAGEARKPIVIHTREAWEDTIALLEVYWRPYGLGGIMHCFSGGPDQAALCLDLWIPPELRWDLDISQNSRRSGSRAHRARRPDSNRDRRPVPGAGSASR